MAYLTLEDCTQLRLIPFGDGVDSDWFDEYMYDAADKFRYIFANDGIVVNKADADKAQTAMDEITLDLIDMPTINK